MQSLQAVEDKVRCRQGDMVGDEWFLSCHLAPITNVPLRQALEAANGRRLCYFGIYSPTNQSIWCRSGECCSNYVLPSSTFSNCCTVKPYHAASPRCTGYSFVYRTVVSVASHLTDKLQCNGAQHVSMRILGCCVAATIEFSLPHSK